MTNQERALTLANVLYLPDRRQGILYALDEAEQRGPSPKALAVARLEAKIEALEGLLRSPIIPWGVVNQELARLRAELEKNR